MKSKRASALNNAKEGAQTPGWMWLGPRQGQRTSRGQLIFPESVRSRGRTLDAFLVLDQNHRGWSNSLQQLSPSLISLPLQQ